ncbi:MAG TPA: sulfatase, partial [Actinomycetota bacterium]|nr:sulfatase [Actinomycetota bacterium]
MNGAQPSRRVALAAALVLVAMAASSAASWSGGPSSASFAGISNARPNIILILTDDQRWDTLWAMPHVRALLGGHGMTFRNAFATTALCCPSRASILTGKTSRHTGVYQNVMPHGGVLAFDDHSTLATWLHAVGYTNAYIGKYLNSYWLAEHHIPPGWDEWNAITTRPTIRYFDYTVNENGRLVDYGEGNENYSTTVLEGLALRFLRDAQPPFFLHFSPIAPHTPVVPAAIDDGRYRSIPPLSAPSFNEQDVSDKPWGRLHPPLTPGQVAEQNAIRQDSLEALQSVDRAVAAMVRVLAERDQLYNTVIVFMSDNGLMLGEHRLQQKIWPYEEAIRVPLVIRAPWIPAPQFNSDLVLNIDIAPTLAELAGVKADHPDGRSLMPFLRGDHPPWRQSFLEEFLGPNQLNIGGPPGFNAIRTKRYLYVEYRTGWRELYDLDADPYQDQNLAGRPETA